MANPALEKEDDNEASQKLGFSTGISFGPDVRPEPRDGSPGGIYHTRSINRASFDRRSATRVSQDPGTGPSTASQDVEDGEDWRDNQTKTKQVFHGTTLLWLAYQSIGVIYGDIGTSPLYVFSSTFQEAPEYYNLVQALSVIIWSLTIMVTLKYVFIILHADNEGEGGTFSCYSLLTRYANITSRDPREEVTVRMERHLSTDMSHSNRTIRDKIERSKITHVLLKTIGILAVSMVMADGILTPAQSVLGAVQGLKVVKPDLPTSTIVGTSCGVLIVLFLIQPLGTTKLASAFAPIVMLWLAFNGGFGIYNLVKFDYTVLKAFSPYFAIEFFSQHKTHGWRMLGGILLSFTGVEALFADLGAFSLRAIQISWMCFTYPCLLLAYVGQAAYISHHPDAFDNPFFNSAPPGMLYPALIVAVLTAIVASQAMITAVFQLISQIMKLSYCPQVKVIHTSRVFHGQLYVPFVNWILMIGAVLVTAVYSDTTRLGNAYGVCVMFVTFFDTCMVTLVSLIVWKFSPYLIFLPWLFFALIDGLYLSSSLLKVPDGAWFTITVSGILTAVFLLWRFGKENQWRAEAEDRIRPSSLIRKDTSGSLRLTDKFGGDSLSIIRGMGIFFDKTGVLTPAVFTHFVSKFVAVPEIAIFFHLHPVEIPSVAPGERYHVSRFNAMPGCYRLVVKHGFMDEVISPDLAALLYRETRESIIKQSRQRLGLTDIDTQDGGDLKRVNGDATTGVSKSWTGLDVARPGSSQHHPLSNAPIELCDKELAAELAHFDRAYAARIMYIIGKEQMRIRTTSSILRKITLSIFLWIRENTRAKIANLKLAMDRVVEVGFVKEI